MENDPHAIGQRLSRATPQKCTNELNSIEKGVLASVRNNGMIPYPQGTAREIESTFKILQDLARRGFVRYLDKTGYRAYFLTAKMKSERT